jgi:hypothetical protein
MGIFPRILTISAAIVTVSGTFTAASSADATPATYRGVSKTTHLARPALSVNLLAGKDAQSRSMTALRVLGIEAKGSKNPTSTQVGVRKEIRDLSISEIRAFLRAMRKVGETRRNIIRDLSITEK